MLWPVRLAKVGWAWRQRETYEGITVVDPLRGVAISFPSVVPIPDAVLCAGAVLVTSAEPFTGVILVPGVVPFTAAVPFTGAILFG